MIALQYNPDSLSRTLQIQSLPGGQDGVRVDALRLRGPAVETIKIEAELDATDQLEFPNQFPMAVQYGLQPQLAQLEMLINPTVETLLADDAMANAGTLEIIPLEQPLTLFVWSRSRVVPVRLTEFSITEEAFDTALNPIRAKVSLGMRVLNVDDLGFEHPGGQLFMAYLTQQGSARRAGDIGRAHRSRTGRIAMNYPLQALIQLGVVPPVTFPTDSRYYGSGMLQYTAPDGQSDSVPGAAHSFRSRARRTMRRSTQHTVKQGDRLDLIAAKYLGDPLMFWLICDANGAIRPDDLVATPGSVLAITTPQGVPGGTGA